MTNRDDSSVESELESMMESGGGRRSKKWNKYQTGDDGLDHREQDLEDAMEELTEKRDTTKIQALKRVRSILLIDWHHLLMLLLTFCWNRS